MALMVFALLSVDVVFNGPLARLDITVSQAVTPIHAGLPATLAEQLADAGAWPVGLAVLLAVALLLSLVRHQFEPLILSASVLGLLAVLGTVLKAMFGRRGPLDIHPEIAFGGAFPSGHAATAVVVSFLIAYLIGKSGPRTWQLLLWLAALVWSLAIGWSRVYLNVHWLTDVLAGWALGAAIVGGVLGLSGRLSLKKRIMR